MLCRICQKEFIPNKYHPHQQVCLRLECQKIRQIQNEREWRIKNPDYFKFLGQEAAWREKRRRYNRLWKFTHKGSLREKEAGESHKVRHREYMREYMRKYRQIR